MPTESGSGRAQIERVRELLTPRGRREQGRFAVEGPTLISEARRSGSRIHAIYAVADRLADHPEIAAWEADGLPIHLVAARTFARLSDLESPSGLLAVLDRPDVDLGNLMQRPGPVLLLAGVSDPGNAGTLIRSAEAFGAAGVVCGRGGVDPYAPKVVRAAMGSLFRLPVAVADPAALIAAAAASGRPIVALDLDGNELDGGGLSVKSIVAVGNERRGVRDWLPRWDASVRIPHAGPTESLNAAVAGSIALYVLARGRR